MAFSTLSIIIPVRSYHDGLLKTLSSLRDADSMAEIILAAVDHDELLKSTAQRYQAKLMPVNGRGRGAALVSGAAASSGDWLFFLHDDTGLQTRWHNKVETFMADRAHQKTAAYCRFRQDQSDLRARILEILVALRCFILAMPYGDQGLLIARDFYNDIGGFRSDYPLMEDVDLVHRIGRKNLKRLSIDAVTSSIRYQGGYMRRILRNARCLFLYYRGVSPKKIAALYEKS